MAKKNNVVEGRTVEMIMAELNKSVDKFNLSNDDSERVELRTAQAQLVKDYNDTSLLTQYSIFMDAESKKKGDAIMSLARMKSYPTVSVQEKTVEDVSDGVKTQINVRSVKNGQTLFNVEKFILWAEDHNKKIAANPLWAGAVLETRKTIETAWKKYRACTGENHKISNTQMKKSIQALFDALVFIETKPGSGLNALVANTQIAQDFFQFSNSIKLNKTVKDITIHGEVLPNKVWDVLLLNGLNLALTGKTMDIYYGTEDPEEEESNSEDDNTSNKDAKSEKK